MCSANMFKSQEAAIADTMNHAFIIFSIIHINRNKSRASSGMREVQKYDE